MLNGKIIKLSTGGNFSVVPEGVYTAELVDINLMENVVTSFAPEGKTLLEFKFAILDDIEIPAEGDTPASNTRGRFLWHRMSPSLNEKSTLSKLVKAMIGRVLTPAEAMTFNLESLVGKQVQTVVTQTPSKDGTRVYSNISSYLKAGKQLPAFDGDAQRQVVAESSTTPLSAKSDTEVDELLKNL